MVFYPPPIRYRGVRHTPVVAQGAAPVRMLVVRLRSSGSGRDIASLRVPEGDWAAYGEELSMERARELIGVLAAGFGLRALSRQVVKLVPVGGWAASAAIADGCGLAAVTADRTAECTPSAPTTKSKNC